MKETAGQKNTSTELVQLVSFIIGNEEYGLYINSVKEINRLTQITKIPNAPDYIEGIINLRGSIIPVIDLRSRLGLPKKESDKNTRIIVVEVSGKTVGFIVDEVKEVLRIPDDIMDSPPDIVTNVNSEFIEAVGKLDNRLIIIIDHEKLLSSKEKDQLKDMQNS